MLTLKIPGDIFEQMVQQAKAEAPIEACGILAGRGGGVEKLYQMTNTDQSHDHFMMEPQEQFKVVKDIRAANLEMLAIYHSHPETPARPSVVDIRLALTPGVVYVIVSLKDAEPVTKGFLIENNSVIEVPVEIKVEQE
ncbi:MAG: M67 family metallopeptidase [Deltaproteobacteria bacterium]|nr:M67 family metallopeptidase [Deltaproteobacteria bacterium]